MRSLLEIDPEAKAVVSSGYSEDNATACYRERCFCAFLQKPYRLEEFRRTIDGLLAHHISSGHP